MVLSASWQAIYDSIQWFSGLNFRSIFDLFHDFGSKVSAKVSAKSHFSKKNTNDAQKWGAKSDRLPRCCQKWSKNAKNGISQKVSANRPEGTASFILLIMLSYRGLTERCKPSDPRRPPLSLRPNATKKHLILIADNCRRTRD